MADTTELLTWITLVCLLEFYFICKSPEIEKKKGGIEYIMRITWKQREPSTYHASIAMSTPSVTPKHLSLWYDRKPTKKPHPETMNDLTSGQQHLKPGGMTGTIQPKTGLPFFVLFVATPVTVIPFLPGI